MSKKEETNLFQKEQLTFM